MLIMTVFFNSWYANWRLNNSMITTDEQKLKAIAIEYAAAVTARAAAHSALQSAQLDVYNCNDRIKALETKLADFVGDTIAERYVHINDQVVIIKYESGKPVLCQLRDLIW